MTCAACAARIEKKLNRLEGVEATVNFATEEASVRYNPARAPGRARRDGRRGRLRRGVAAPVRTTSTRGAAGRLRLHGWSPRH